MVVRPLARLLAPTSLAFVGGAPARTAIEQCLALGFEGDLWPVHPTRDEVCGLPAYRSVDDLPGAPDAALVAVNREATIDVVGRLAARGSGAAVCYASGFAEVGAEGARLQAELVAAAGDMPVVGPNCYGTVSAVAGAALWPDQQGLGRADRGIALVTQSGNIGLNLTMQTRPMSIAHLLTLGNQAGVGIEDCLEALVADPAVTGIGLHIEALHDVERFSAACAVAAARAVPVVALKTGTSDAGARIAASHTGSMVGSDVAYSALFGRLGVHRVDSIPGLLDALHVLTSLGPLSGNRVVSLSCSGGEASVVADKAAGLDLDFPDFPEEQARRIAGTLSEFVSVANPLDYHTFIWGDEEALGNCFTAVLDGAFDASLLVLDFPSVGLDDATWWPTLRAFGAARAASGTPALLVGSMAENLPTPPPHAAGADPLAFRLARLTNPRLRAVLEDAAARAGFADRPRTPGVGMGIACGTEKASYAAACVEVAVDVARGSIDVRHIWQTFECGAIQDPENLDAQVRGCIIMGLGGALTEAMAFEGGRILNASLHQYRVPRFADVPPMSISLLNRPDLPSAGAGETPIVAVAPAIANAVFDAVGVRVRSMPIRLA